MKFYEMNKLTVPEEHLLREAWGFKAACGFVKRKGRREELTKDPGFHKLLLVYFPEFEERILELQSHNVGEEDEESDAGSEESQAESEADEEEEAGEDHSGTESEVGVNAEDGEDGVVGDVGPSQPPSLEVEPGGDMQTLEAEEAVEEGKNGLGEGDSSGHRDVVAEEPPSDYFPDNQEGLELSPEPKPAVGCCLDLDLGPDLDVRTCARPLRGLRRAEHLPDEPLPAEPSVEPVVVESDDDDVGDGPLCNLEAELARLQMIASRRMSRRAAKRRASEEGVMVIEDSLPCAEMKNMDNLETQPMMFQVLYGPTHVELMDDDDLSAQPLMDNDPSHGEIGPSQDPNSARPSQDRSDPAHEELCPSQVPGSDPALEDRRSHSTGVGGEPKGSSSDIKGAPPKPSKSKKVLPPVPVMTPSDDSSRIPVLLKRDQLKIKAKAKGKDNEDEGSDQDEGTEDCGGVKGRKGRGRGRGKGKGKGTKRVVEDDGSKSQGKRAKPIKNTTEIGSDDESNPHESEPAELPTPKHAAKGKPKAGAKAKASKPKTNPAPKAKSSAKAKAHAKAKAKAAPKSGPKRNKKHASPNGPSESGDSAPANEEVPPAEAEPHQPVVMGEYLEGLEAELRFQLKRGKKDLRGSDFENFSFNMSSVSAYYTRSRPAVGLKTKRQTNRTNKEYCHFSFNLKDAFNIGVAMYCAQKTAEWVDELGHDMDPWMPTVQNFVQDMKLTAQTAMASAKSMMEEDS